jgi:hypothetical protein
MTTDSLYDELAAVASRTAPEPEFANRLEQQLRAAHARRTSVKSAALRRKLAVAAASLALTFGLFATVPPLRALAQSLIDYFVPSDPPVGPPEPGTYPESIFVDTIEDAEAIAGFDAREWTADGFTIIHVSAAEGLVHILYERVGDRGNLVSLIQFRDGVLAETEPVPPTEHIQPIVVNGVEGQFVTGGWVQPTGGDVTWIEEHWRQAYWREDGINYHLRVSSTLARDASDTVAIAESLK